MDWIELILQDGIRILVSFLVALHRQVRPQCVSGQTNLLKISRFGVPRPFYITTGIFGLTACNHCTMMTFMPIVKRFANCRVSINPKDHNPPHFHVRMNDDREAWVAIATLEILHGKIFMREIADVLDWAKANRALLAEKFEELQQ